MTDHVLYEPSDFTDEEMDRRNRLAVAVCEGGLGVCKLCGGYESELENTTCEDVRAAREIEREQYIARYGLS